MRNLTGSLYYKLLSYSKNLNRIIDIVKTNSVSDLEGRYKHGLVLEEFNQEESEKINKYQILDLKSTKSILRGLVKTLEKLNNILDIDVQTEIDYFTQIS